MSILSVVQEDIIGWNYKLVLSHKLTTTDTANTNSKHHTAVLQDQFNKERNYPYPNDPNREKLKKKEIK